MSAILKITVEKHTFKTFLIDYASKRSLNSEMNFKELPVLLLKNRLKCVLR